MPKLFPPYVPPTRPAHPLEARIAELRALDRQYLDEELQLTKDGARIEKPAPTDEKEIRALQMLADFAPPEPKSKTKARSKHADPNKRLEWLLGERAVLERALEIAGQRLMDARLQHVREFMTASAANWNENTRQICLTIVTLWQLNRQRETLRKKSGYPSRPTAGIQHKQLLGLAEPGENQSAGAKRFIEEAVQAGIVTEREIAQLWRNQ